MKKLPHEIVQRTCGRDTGADTLSAEGGNNYLDGGDGSNLLFAGMGGNMLTGGTVRFRNGATCAVLFVRSKCEAANDDHRQHLFERSAA